MTAAEIQKHLVCILNNNQFTRADKKAMYLAINAINKQIPKKPTNLRGFGKYSTVIGTCPICGGGNNSKYPYCGGCGQALDWEVENAHT